MDKVTSDTKEFKNYCKDDGSYIDNITLSNYTLKKNISMSCSKCGEETKLNNNYCKICGQSLEEVAQINGNMDNSNSELKGILGQCNLKKVLLTSGLSILILFIVSLMIKLMMFIQGNSLNSLLSPLHILLGLNIGSISSYSATMMGSGSVIINIGIIIILIIPVMAISISSIIFLKKENTDAKSTLINSLGVGITYGMILAIISAISRVQLTSNSMLSYGYSIGFRYEIFSLLINGFIIGFMTSFIIGFKRDYNKECIYLNLLKMAFKAIVVAYISIFVILLILKISNSNYLYEFGMSGLVSRLNPVLLISQVSAYILAIANFAVVNINNSAIGILSMSESGDLRLINYALTALTALILLLAGCKLKYNYGKEGIKPVLILSTFYAVFMGILAIFTRISIDTSVGLFSVTNQNIVISMGFGIGFTVIISFIYSFLMIFLGYKLNMLDNYTGGLEDE